MSNYNTNFIAGLDPSTNLLDYIGNTRTSIEFIDTSIPGDPFDLTGYDPLKVYKSPTTIPSPSPIWSTLKPSPSTILGTTLSSIPYLGQVEFDIELNVLKVFNGKNWIEVDIVNANETEEEQREASLKRETIRIQREIKHVS